MPTLNERLKKARELAGFRSAAEAAEALGVAYPTYAGHENGSSGGFRARSAELYARRLGVRFEWLMSGKGPMSPGARITDDEQILALLARIEGLTEKDIQTAFAIIKTMLDLRRAESAQTAPDDPPPHARRRRASAPSR
jgi:transcriptional regulator with XRE-family HTH domain